MKKVQDFVAGLTKSRKSAAKVTKTISAAYKDKAWRLILIYFVIMKEKADKTSDTQAISVQRKTKRTADIVAAVAANVKKDWPATCKDITFAYGGVQWDKAFIL
jgi:hypothetical protein